MTVNYTVNLPVGFLLPFSEDEDLLTFLFAMDGFGFPVIVASLLRFWLPVEGRDERDWLWKAVDDVMGVLLPLHQYHTLYQIWCLELRDCLRFLRSESRWLEYPDLVEELAEGFVLSMIDELDSIQFDDSSIFDLDVYCAASA